MVASLISSSDCCVGLSFRQCVEPATSAARRGENPVPPVFTGACFAFWSPRRKPGSRDFVLLKYLVSKKGYLYILSSGRNGTLYVGVTSDLVKRIEEHRQKLVEGFTKKYGVTNLVYFETFKDIREAIIRERQIKEWKRKWKTELIQSMNPYWRDLYEDIL